MMKIKKIIPFVILLQIALTFFANASDQVEMADTMRSEGKIYVVVTVIAIIFSGLALYLFILDKKLGKLEEQMKTKNK